LVDSLKRGFQANPRRFSTNPLGSFPLGEIVSFGLWMQKQGYRRSTAGIIARPEPRIIAILGKSLASFFFLIDMIESSSAKWRQLSMYISEGGHTCGRMDDRL
jgi:hypothetical protein